MSKAEEFRHETLDDAPSVVRYLQAMAAGLSQGQLLFRVGEREFSVAPQGLVRFRLKGKREGRKVEVTARLAWKERGEEDAAKEPAPAQPLVIGPIPST